MKEKKDKKPNQGDFIDLEKNQYKKKSTFKLLLIILILVILASILIFFYKKGNFEIISNYINDDSGKPAKHEVQFLERESLDIPIMDGFNQEILDKLDDLNKEVLDSKIKLNQYESIVKSLNDKLDFFEVQQKNNQDFLFAEKYMIINDLLSLKNKFEKRQDFSGEIENLSLKFRDNASIKNLLIFFENLDIKSLIKKEFLLEQLNKKIRNYELDTNTFINQNNEDLFIADFGHESDKNFINYVINFLKSTFKITKFQENIDNESQISPDINLIIESVKSAKEYLIFGDLKKSISKIKELKLDDYILDMWILDAEKLDQAKENLNNLESTLLFTIGKKIDKDN